MHHFAFEKLETWQLARKLVKRIYTLSEKYPAGERFELARQIRRSAISVSSNLAEGVSRTTSKAQASYSEISYASLMELYSQLILSQDLGLIDSLVLEEFKPKIFELSNKINALRKAQLNN